MDFFVEMLPELEVMFKEIDIANFKYINGPIKSEEIIIEEQIFFLHLFETRIAKLLEKDPKKDKDVLS